MNILSAHVFTVCQKIGEDFSALGFSVSWAGRFWLESDFNTPAGQEVLAVQSSPDSRAVDWRLPENRVVMADWHGDWQTAWVVQLSERFAALHYLLEPMVDGFRLSSLSMLVDFYLDDGQICFVGLDEDIAMATNGDGFENNPDDTTAPVQKNIHQLELRLVRRVV
jgi:hypothetical protein